MNKSDQFFQGTLIAALNAPDEELGRVLLATFIGAQANDLGIEPGAISKEFGEKVVHHILSLEANGPSETALERALHLSANGDFERAGGFIREIISMGVLDIQRNELAQKYIPIGINKSEQASQFGAAGAEAKRQEGSKNRNAVLTEASKIAKQWTVSRKPTVREIAPRIAKKLGISERTVRNHLSREEWEKLLG